MKKMLLTFETEEQFVDALQCFMFDQDRGLPIKMVATPGDIMNIQIGKTIKKKKDKKILSN